MFDEAICYRESPVIQKYQITGKKVANHPFFGAHSCILVRKLLTKKSTIKVKSTRATGFPSRKKRVNL